MAEPEAALVLFSGGQDSATCPACALRQGGWDRYRAEDTRERR